MSIPRGVEDAMIAYWWSKDTRFEEISAVPHGHGCAESVIVGAVGVPKAVRFVDGEVAGLD
jgi:hypothetical protein